MKIYENLVNHKNLPLCIALGYFDGVHKGHKAVISQVVGLKLKGFVPSVLTFKRSPKSILSDTDEYQITDNETKIKIFESLGVEVLYMTNFEEIKGLTPKEFVRDILKGKLNARCVVCGFNYHFGKNALGDANELGNLCENYGIETKIVKPILYKCKPISSSRIREAIKEDDVVSADNMLSK